jgi:hypothetical protein
MVMSEYRSNPYGRLPKAGSAVADQLRDQFLASILGIMGEPELLWTPKITDTTTATEDSRNADTITWDASVATRLSGLGSGMQQDFDGDDDEGDTPDSDDHSFGDGAVDEPFSVISLINPDSDTSAQTIISKQNSATVDEWELRLTATNGYPTFDLIDASTSGIIGRSHDVAIGTSWTLIVATYDGSRAVTGINLYKDGAVVDDGAGGTTGTYTAMQNSGSLVRIGCRYTTNERFYNGNMALLGVARKALSIDEVNIIKNLCNGFFDLTL